MTDKVIETYAVIKQIDNEIKALLNERETYRQRLIQIMPDAEQIVKEMELAPVEEKTLGGKDEKIK